MDELQRIVIEHECRKLMSLYCHHIDHQDAEGFAGLYAEDAYYKPAAAPAPILGRPAILDWIKAYPGHRLGRHLTTNEIVEVVDAEHATGSCYAVVFRDPDPQPGVLSDRVTPRSVCEYRDEFRRTADGWRFSRREYRIDFLQAEETNRPTPWRPGAR